MKLRTIPQTYEAIVFNGITREVENFILKHCCEIHPQDDYFILSDFIGNHRLEIGDYLYKTNNILNSVGVARNNSNFIKYFEVIE